MPPGKREMSKIILRFARDTTIASAGSYKQRRISREWLCCYML